MYATCERPKIDPAVWKCSACKNKHSIGEWDSNTLIRCGNRQEKRNFKSLSIESCRKHGSKRVYLCPSCGVLVQGFNISICFD